MKTVSNVSEELALGGAESPMTVRLIPLELIEESPLNPRVHFDQGEHEELTLSMREHGFTLSAMTVRRVEPGAVAGPVNPAEEDGPWRLYHPVTREPYHVPAQPRPLIEVMARNEYAYRYEVVMGARRRRAAKAAGLTLAPCLVREVTDLELVALALIENLQRKQLTAVEEANGYAAMVERGAGIEVIAQQIGRTPDHVRQTLELRNLPKEAREWVENGKLPRSIGYLIGRIPNETLRDRAAQEILHPLTGEAPMTYRAAEDYIQRNCVRTLRGATWEMEDAELVPVQEDAQGRRVAGGACTGCPFNSSGPRRRGECLNVACYAAKEAAVWERFAAQETNPELNRRALSQAECRELFYDDGALQWGTQFVELTAEPPVEALRPGVTSQPWRDLVKGSGIEVLVARDPQGKKRELVVATLAKAAAVQQGHKIFKESEREERRERKRLNDDEHKEATLKDAEARKLEAAFQAKFNAAIRKELRAKVVAHGHAPPMFFRFMARVELALVGAGPEVAKSRECDGAGEVEDWLEKCSDAEALALLVELLVFGDVSVPDHAKLEPAAKAFGVDCEAIEKRVRLEMVPAKSEAAAPKKGRKKKDADQVEEVAK